MKRVVKALERICYMFMFLVGGVLVGSSLQPAAEAVDHRERACAAVVERADTLMQTYADAYAAAVSQAPDRLDYWQRKMNEYGWDYVNAREECWK